MRQRTHRTHRIRRSRRSRQALLCLAGAALLAASGCSGEPPAEDEVTAKVPEQVLADVSSGNPRDLIVVFSDPAVVSPSLSDQPRDVGDDGDLALRAAAYGQMKRAAVEMVPAGSLEVRRSYENLPVLFVNVRDREALSSLAQRPEVLRIVEDRSYELFDNLALIRATEAIAKGKDGAGVSVAVLDTGLDYTRAAFGSCTAPGAPATCKVAYAADLAPSDKALDANGHGTNVAGIVGRVAPGAKLIGLDVFDGEVAKSNVILDALNWVLANRATYKIAAVNMSLGGGSFTAPCGNDGLAAAITALRRGGVFVAVASGNNGYKNAVASPACAPDAVSVGAVYDGDQGGWRYGPCTDAKSSADLVTCFSNSASFLTLLAPGANISAAGITASGTSQATPHVAGAAAVLRAAFPGESVDATVKRMTSTGKPVTDPKSGVTTPRLDVLAALSGVKDTTPPTDGTVTATPANGRAQLKWDGFADAGSGVARYLVVGGAQDPGACSGTPLWSGTDKAAALANLTNGTTYTFRVCAVDGAGNVSKGATATARPLPEFDPPTGALAIAGGLKVTSKAAVRLALAAQDPSGVTRMCISNSAACTAWVNYAAAPDWTLAAADGAKTVYAWLQDKWGNTSKTPLTATVTLDGTAPKDGALTPRAGSAQVALSWTGFQDPGSGVASFRVVGAAAAPAAGCATGTLIYSGAATSFTHRGLTAGKAYYYRVCAVDGAGNVSTGASAQATPTR